MLAARLAWAVCGCHGRTGRLAVSRAETNMATVLELVTGVTVETLEAEIAVRARELSLLRSILRSAKERAAYDAHKHEPKKRKR